MANGQVSNEEAEKLRQEGREEVLDWLVKRGFLNYSIPDDCYFNWNRHTEIMTDIPWTKSKKNQPDKIDLSVEIGNIMTPTPPYFQSQMEEQKKWDDGFKAGVAEVLHALSENVSDEDLASPTKDWVKDFSNRFSKKYL